MKGEDRNGGGKSVDIANKIAESDSIQDPSE